MSTDYAGVKIPFSPPLPWAGLPALLSTPTPFPLCIHFLPFLPLRPSNIMSLSTRCYLADLQPPNGQSVNHHLHASRIYYWPHPTSSSHVCRSSPPHGGAKSLGGNSEVSPESAGVEDPLHANNTSRTLAWDLPAVQQTPMGTREDIEAEAKGNSSSGRKSPGPPPSPAGSQPEPHRCAFENSSPPSSPPRASAPVHCLAVDPGAEGRERCAAAQPWPLLDERSGV